MKTANQLALIHYVNTPHVESFQTIAGSRLENLSKHQQWSILAVLSRAATVAKNNESKSVNTFNAIFGSLYMIPSDKTMKCLDSLNGFPIDRVEQLIAAIEDIRPLKAFPAWSE